jgi:hypothetical protein
MSRQLEDFALSSGDFRGLSIDRPSLFPELVDETLVKVACEDVRTTNRELQVLPMGQRETG